MARLTQQPFGTTRDGIRVDLYTMSNASGASVRFLSYGGTIKEINVPDRDGHLGNVILGFRTMAEYEDIRGFFGALIGRFANRIAKGKFRLDGTDYTLPTNDRANTLHGGIKGFDRVVWNVTPQEDGSAELSYISRQGEEGFPGTLSVKVIYAWSDDNTLKIEYLATTDRPTIVNLTSHPYFNLAGEGAGSIAHHHLTLHADSYVACDAGGIPTGQLIPVYGTAFDFRRPTRIGAGLRSDDAQVVQSGGYDHNWVVAGGGAGQIVEAAVLSDPHSGRRMTLCSDQPGVQFYSGNSLDGTVCGTSGHPYNPHDGLCLETQHFPDAPNQPAFASTRLDPMETYHTVTLHQFTAVD